VAVLAATLDQLRRLLPVMFCTASVAFVLRAGAVVLALFASYFVAMTVVPLFCSRFMKAPAHHHRHPEHPQEDSGAEEWVVGDVPDDQPAKGRRTLAPAPASAMERFNREFSHRFERLLHWYEARVRTAVRRPGLVVAAVMGGFAASLALYPLIGVAFFPRTDAGQFVINMKSPSGTRIEVSSQDVARAEAIVRAVVDPQDLELIVANIGVQPGFSSIYTSNAGPHTATVQVALKEEHRIGSYEYMARVPGARRSAARERLLQLRWDGRFDSQSGLPAPIDVQLSARTSRRSMSASLARGRDPASA
jgi:multidrug efflux pump subunit AcrB